jgi:hypothetical protein
MYKKTRGMSTFLKNAGIRDANVYVLTPGELQETVVRVHTGPQSLVSSEGS